MAENSFAADHRCAISAATDIPARHPFGLVHSWFRVHQPGSLPDHAFAEHHALRCSKLRSIASPPCGSGLRSRGGDPSPAEFFNIRHLSIPTFSAPSGKREWHFITMLLFSADGFAPCVTRFSVSARAVTVANTIAARCVATRRVGSNGVSRTDAISRARKDEKTIATGSGSTGDVAGSGHA